MVANRFTYAVGLVLAVFVVLPKGEELQAQVSIIEHGPFTEMLDKYAEINRDPNRRLSGYRVQILATTDRLKLEEAKEKFESLYPYSADWKHEPPYYKLRTGAFTDRAKATSFLYKVKRNFPSAYPAIVKDIRPSELLNYR
ncbi:MAG: SPOR domain-containing protein [Saprospiraceae bacterium]